MTVFGTKHLPFLCTVSAHYLLHVVSIFMQNDTVNDDTIMSRTKYLFRPPMHVGFLGTSDQIGILKCWF